MDSNRGLTNKQVAMIASAILALAGGAVAILVPDPTTKAVVALILTCVSTILAALGYTTEQENQALKVDVARMAGERRADAIYANKP